MISKPKILLVIDRPNWAYDYIAKMLEKNLSNKYHFYKLISNYHVKREAMSFRYFITHPARLIKAACYERFSYRIRYDIVVYMWWYIPEYMKTGNIKGKYTLSGIFTELFPPGGTVDFEGDINSFIKRYIDPSDGIIAGNMNILEMYKNHSLPVYYASGATDTDIFHYNRQKRIGNELRVCWTGNPNRNFKGFYDFIQPAVELAQIKYPDIKLITRFSGPLKTLPDFYKSADVMVNASVGDAGPGFIIDAGACGVPTISSNTGFASEIISDNVNGFIVDRSVESISNKIIELYENRVLLENASDKIARDVKFNWNQKSRSKYWDEVFQNILKSG